MKGNDRKMTVNFLQMHVCCRININNYVVEKWLLQLFPVDLIDFDNILPRKLQSPENI